MTAPARAAATAARQASASTARASGRMDEVTELRALAVRRRSRRASWRRRTPRPSSSSSIANPAAPAGWRESSLAEGDAAGAGARDRGAAQSRDVEPAGLAARRAPRVAAGVVIARGTRRLAQLAQRRHAARGSPRRGPRLRPTSRRPRRTRRVDRRHAGHRPPVDLAFALPHDVNGATSVRQLARLEQVRGVGRPASSGLGRS